MSIFETRIDPLGNTPYCEKSNSKKSIIVQPINSLSGLVFIYVSYIMSVNAIFKFFSLSVFLAF